MSYILYYSNHCQHSKSILQEMSKFNHSEVHFICIDNRVTENGKIYILLGNGQKIPMPETVNCVPSMLLLDEQYKILTGKDILIKFKSQQQRQQQPHQQQQEQNNTGPTSYAFDNRNTGGLIVSDTFSFFNEDPHEQSHQMHNYVSLHSKKDIGWYDISNDQSKMKEEGMIQAIDQLKNSRQNEINQYQK